MIRTSYAFSALGPHLDPSVLPVPVLLDSSARASCPFSFLVSYFRFALLTFSHVLFVPAEIVGLLSTPYSTISRHAFLCSQMCLGSLDLWNRRASQQRFRAAANPLPPRSLRDLVLSASISCAIVPAPHLRHSSPVSTFLLPNTPAHTAARKLVSLAR